MITIVCPKCKGNTIYINASMYYPSIRDAECTLCESEGILHIGNLEYIQRLETGETLIELENGMRKKKVKLGVRK